MPLTTVPLAIGSLVRFAKESRAYQSGYQAGATSR